MAKNRAFSLYDIEEFLKEAGAEKVNEKAVVSFEQELENTVNELVAEAEIYAQYAGRSTLKADDINMVNEVGKSSRLVLRPAKIKKRIAKRQKPIHIITNMAVRAQQL